MFKCTYISDFAMLQCTKENNSVLKLIILSDLFKNNSFWSISTLGKTIYISLIFKSSYEEKTRQKTTYS